MPLYSPSTPRAGARLQEVTLSLPLEMFTTQESFNQRLLTQAGPRAPPALGTQRAALREPRVAGLRGHPGKHSPGLSSQGLSAPQTTPRGGVGLPEQRAGGRKAGGHRDPWRHREAGLGLTRLREPEKALGGGVHQVTAQGSSQELRPQFR